MKTLLPLAIILSVSSCVTDEEPHEYVKAGSELPKFTVVTSTGDTVTSESLKGRESVITFFNTSCGDCRRELPSLQQAMEEHPGITFLCIAREEADSTIAAYWATNGLTLPYSPQPDRRVYSLFATAGIPRTYVVAPDLTVTACY